MWTLAFAFSVLRAEAAIAQQCREAELLAPQRGSVVLETRPTLVWKDIPGVEDYRVQIEARTPNGPVLSRVDNRVSGTTFTPRSVLAGGRAAAKVRITEDCRGQDAIAISEMPPAFFIDPLDGCASPHGVRVQERPNASITWAQAAGALRTEISVFSTVDGRVIRREETAGQTYDLTPMDAGVTIALRSRCSEGFSRGVYRVLAAPRG